MQRIVHNTSINLYVIIMPPTSFRVNLYSIVFLNVKNFLLEAGAIPEVQLTATGFEHTNG